ncbi:hypothetical protein JCM8208_002539 [Rhodotorula glutinis]
MASRTTLLELRGLSRQAAASPLKCARPGARRLHSSRSPRTTHSFASSPAAGPAEGFKSAPKSNRRLFAGAGAAALAATAYLAATGSSDADGDRPLLLANPNDPLSALDPAVLGRTTAHLTAASVPDLVRQWVVYAVSEQSLLVQMGPWMVGKLQWAHENVPILGPAVWAVFAAGMDNTFYRVFVGGESVPGCTQQVQNYANRGVGVMLNYSAEAPLGSAKSGGGIDQAAMTEITNAVSQAAKLTPAAADSVGTIKPALFAIKLSGLIFDASILARASLALASDSTIARGGRLSSSTLFPQSPELSSEDHELLDKLYEGLRKVAAEAQTHNLRLLVDAEQSWFQPAIDRYVDLLSEEFNKVRPATPISSAPSAPVVYNTYQCYLRDAPTRIAAALAHADEHGYSFGAKLVRGAYQESERARHQKLPAFEAGVPCVVWGSKAETDKCYDECAALLEKRLVRDLKKQGAEAVNEAGVGVVLASHNGTSMKRFLESLRDDGLAKEEDGKLAVDERLRGRVAFGQLMGMSDNLTQTLIDLIHPSSDPAAAPLVVKYMPYASLEQGLPYLVRRANENQSILQGDPTSGRGGAREERRAVGKEIRRRMGLSF